MGAHHPFEDDTHLQQPATLGLLPIGEGVGGVVVVPILIVAPVAAAPNLYEVGVDDFAPFFHEVAMVCCTSLNHHGHHLGNVKVVGLVGELVRETRVLHKSGVNHLQAWDELRGKVDIVGVVKVRKGDKLEGSVDACFFPEDFRSVVEGVQDVEGGLPGPRQGGTWFPHVGGHKGQCCVWSDYVVVLCVCFEFSDLDLMLHLEGVACLVLSLHAQG